VQHVGLEHLALQSSFLLPVDVATGAERLVTGTGEDDDTDLVAAAGVLERQRQLLERVARERVVLPRPVDRDPGDVVLGLVEDVPVFARYGALLSRKIRRLVVGSGPPRRRGG